MSYSPAVMLGVVLFALTPPVSARAADLGAHTGASAKDPIYAAASHDWSGPYLGVHAGFGSAEVSSRDGGTHIKNPPFGAFSCGPALTGNYCNVPFELDAGGALGGVQLGYNAQSGGFLIGVEGELGWLDISETETLIRPSHDRDVLSADYGWYGAFTLRAGLIHERALFYVKGGLGFARIETEAADLDVNKASGQFEIFPGSLTRDSGVETGWALGGGIEYALSEDLSVKAEYLYMDFGSSRSVSPQGDIYEHEHALHTAKLGLNVSLSEQPVPLK